MLANLRHLRMFRQVAETGSVTEAALACHVSQPAVTQAMGKIEEILGADLFQRRPQGLFLTDAGRVLAHRVSRAFLRLDGAMADMAREIRVQASWSQLRALIAVTDMENFTLAARRLGLAQPTVHRAITALEAAAGTRFFQRTAHGLIATRAARGLAQAARLALAELDQARADLAELSGREVGRIVIGSLPLSRSNLLPEALLEFRKQRPSLPVEVIDGRYDEMLTGLRRGDIDMVLGALRMPAPIDDVDQKMLFHDSVVIVAGAGHPLAGRRDLTRTDLLAYPWVMARQGTPIRAQLDDFLAGEAPASVVETSSVILMRELLIGSDHLGALSRMQAQTTAEAQALRILPVALPGSDRPIGLTTRTDWEPTIAQRELRDILIRLGESLRQT
ncbi:MAG: LysR family transcriptional regulator [Paracoccus sp. (in: a-proteobacteria)]|uniref:LysR family transcriptional regulator n=1 Tax=Paracoccus sp. TaxID=267 RepID=UPI0026DF55FE|nr:LysR family transcriptional regulator [Paracoccus sp. (in: a-proteobacteria)]MDO5613882.1 LysR family transcriptional regulator [Paracoccus sp. (in: a-proteobacteria)]